MGSYRNPQSVQIVVTKFPSVEQTAFIAVLKLTVLVLSRHNNQIFIASKQRWLRRQPAARLSALNLGVKLFGDTFEISSSAHFVC
tara:strand:+ start:618 stop:872 length:255 start_codon:yes stop_codon:yes gene_type:complete